MFETGFCIVKIIKEFKMKKSIVEISLNTVNKIGAKLATEKYLRQPLKQLNNE